MTANDEALPTSSGDAGHGPEDRRRGRPGARPRSAAMMPPVAIVSAVGVARLELAEYVASDARQRPRAETAAARSSAADDDDEADRQRQRERRRMRPPVSQMNSGAASAARNSPRPSGARTGASQRRPGRARARP